jgi:hypothetical protein
MRHLNLNYKRLGGFLVLLTAPHFMRAAILWDNGGPAILRQGGSAMTDFTQAEDFQVLALSDITGVRFWSLEGAPSDYFGSITWEIRNDAGGAPGNTVIGAGSVTPTSLAAGSVLGFNQFEMDFSLLVNSVIPGVYWLTLHNGPISNITFTDFYWSWADLNATNTATSRGEERSLDPPVPTFSTNDAEHAFLISGEEVPEPGSFVCCAAGLALVALRTVRRSTHGKGVK